MSFFLYFLIYVSILQLQLQLQLQLLLIGEQKVAGYFQKLFIEPQL